jgi:hypothetical protein
MKALRLSLTILPALLLAGCAHSPTLDVLGSYFPAWIVCIVIGLVLTVITRQLLIGFKLNVHLRLAGLVYLCMTVLWTLAAWLLCFKN